MLDFGYVRRLADYLTSQDEETVEVALFDLF